MQIRQRALGHSGNGEKAICGDPAAQFAFINRPRMTCLAAPLSPRAGVINHQYAEFGFAAFKSPQRK
jgi:hypothetical protein